MCDAESGGGHAVARHERLRERLARFQSRAAARSARTPARRPHANRSTRPRLSGSSGPTTVKIDCSLPGSATRPSESPTEPRRSRAERSNTRVSRARQMRRTSRSGGQPGDERVLARAAADDENSHDLNGLACETADRHDVARSADYFVDLDVELRLESAFTRDSLAYLVIA